MEDEVLIHNFFKVGFNGDKSIRRCDLGWSDSSKRDARSDYPETIFRYFVEIVGLNILFYHIKDRQFYTIETEKTPIEVRRIYPNPNWDGKNEIERSGLDGMPRTSSAGELLATFEDPTQIWSGLTIDGETIGNILDNSFILEMD